MPTSLSHAHVPQKKRDYVGAHFKKGLVGIEKSVRMVEHDGRSVRIVPRFAKGSHGAWFPVFLAKKRKMRSFVMKKYNDDYLRSFRIPKGIDPQTFCAREEYAILKAYRDRGYPVLPTVRLIEHEGKEYVLATDMSKVGNLQFKFNDRDQARKLLDPYLPKNEIEKVFAKMHEYGQMNAADPSVPLLTDCWEIVIDTKKRTAKPIIADASLLVYFKHHLAKQV